MVLVIILLGILSALALPKYIDLQQEARIAKYKQIRVAILSRLDMLHYKWLIAGGQPKPGQIESNLQVKIDSQTTVKFTHYGWPIGVNLMGGAVTDDLYHGPANPGGDATHNICRDIFRFLLEDTQSIQAWSIDCGFLDGNTYNATFCADARLSSEPTNGPGKAICILHWAPPYACSLPAMQINYDVNEATFTYGTYAYCENTDELVKIGQQIFK